MTSNVCPPVSIVVPCPLYQLVETWSIQDWITHCQPMVQTVLQPYHQKWGNVDPMLLSSNDSTIQKSMYYDNYRLLQQLNHQIPCIIWDAIRQQSNESLRVCPSFGVRIKLFSDTMLFLIKVK